jgi:membrane-associated phospholipid phosphatase
LSGIISTDLLTKIIKHIIKHSTKRIETQNPPDSESILSSYFLRPNGACDCDILNQNGCQEGKPGMPSGHMAVTVFFLLYLFFLYNHSNNSNNFPKALYMIAATLYAILMGYARYAKRCHNIAQIIGGSIVGILTATFLKFIYLQR